MTARSRLTSQGQISVPAAVRHILGLRPGSVLEWEEQDGQVVVRRAGRYTSEDIHRALFPEGPPTPRSDREIKEGIRLRMKARYAAR